MSKEEHARRNISTTLDVRLEDRVGSGPVSSTAVSTVSQSRVWAPLVV